MMAFLKAQNRLESAVPFIAGAGRFLDDHEVVMPSAGGRRARGCLHRGWKAPASEPRGQEQRAEWGQGVGVDFS